MGVALEVARTFVQNPALTLPAPVTFLLNGGEEPILPAAHGFITQSRFVKDLGAFINLESTGPGGPDIIFQYSGTPVMHNLEVGSEQGWTGPTIPGLFEFNSLRQCQGPASPADVEALAGLPLHFQTPCQTLAHSCRASDMLAASSPSTLCNKMLHRW